jgi:hypothetical protein
MFIVTLTDDRSSLDILAEGCVIPAESRDTSKTPLRIRTVVTHGPFWLIAHVFAVDFVQ